ncbi:hypothetical protein AMJ57_01240 [Parcubacteria bacterium SG8_24]|nr:MAG: hypothetical protein AMJ57_01240 [Parcubacteria bacterium SG8_24]
MTKRDSRIIRFLRTVVRSGYDMEWYRTVRTRHWGGALGYLLGLLATISLVVMALVGPGLFRGAGELRTYISENLPERTHFTVDGGHFSTSLPMPYRLSDEEFFLEVDTSVTGMDFPERMKGVSGVLIGQDAVFLAQSEVERRAYSVKDLPDLRLTKEDMIRWLDKYSGSLAAAFTILIGLTYFLASLTGLLIYILVASLLSLVLARIWRVRLRYGQWFAIGLHAVTLPVLVDAVLSLIGAQIPYAFSVIYFMFIFAVILDERLRPVSRQVESAPEPPAGEAKPGKVTDDSRKRRARPRRQATGTRRGKSGGCQRPARPAAGAKKKTGKG